MSATTSPLNSPAATTQRLPSVFVIGDSISIQYGPSLEKALAGFFHYDRKRGSLEDLDNPDGANGGDSSMVLEYLESRQKADPIRADILVINCGLHDIKMPPDRDETQISQADYARNLRKILRIADEMKFYVVWVRTTPVIDAIHNSRCKAFRRTAADVAVFNSIADELMRERTVIDLHTFSADFGEAGFIDHVHFNEECRRAQGLFLAGALHGVWAALRSHPSVGGFST